jgi:hypothetical protein
MRSKKKHKNNMNYLTFADDEIEFFFTESIFFLYDDFEVKAIFCLSELFLSEEYFLF